VLEPITESDLPELTDVMTRAFDDDTQRHLGQPKGGPPGYDDGSFFRQWLFPYEQSHGYKVLLDGTIVGAFIVWDLPDGHNRLGTIFVDPRFQRQGIGRRSWSFIETTYPHARSWTLDTPGFALSNHRFYEKVCGFTRIDVVSDGDLGSVWVYRKVIKSN
jgi:GNAT superfamily N-acetyltransferase